MAAAFELRLKVINLYRTLYRTRQELFQGDQLALQVSLQKLRTGFLDNKNEKDADKIESLIKLGKEVDTLLKHNTIQCQLNQEGVYEMKIRNNTRLLDNALHPDERK